MPGFSGLLAFLLPELHGTAALGADVFCVSAEVLLLYAHVIRASRLSDGRRHSSSRVVVVVENWELCI